MVTHRDAFAPPGHGHDTSVRARKPMQDGGSKSAARGRAVVASGPGYVGGRRTHANRLEWY